MSASLVGSEMCIRDRPPTVHGLGTQPALQRFQRQLDVARVAASRRPSARLNDQRAARGDATSSTGSLEA
eukprot:8914927-Alexandrium_andersonii.AAC.1